jgi:type I restriction enzyme, S subunit
VKRRDFHRLEDLVDIVSGFAFNSENFGEQGDIPITRIRDVVPGCSSTFYRGPFDDQFVINNGDLLIGMDGEFNCARWKGGRALLNQRVCRIRSASERLHEPYLFHFLPAALKVIEDETPFVTVKHLSTKSIRCIEIPLPLLADQRRIAEVLDLAAVLRAKRLAVLTQLDFLTRSLFLEIFGDLATNPKRWPIQQMQDVVKNGTLVTYGIVQAGQEFPRGVPYIRTGDIVDGEIVLAGLRHTDPAIAAKFQRSRVEAGEIVMSIRATVGTTALVPPELEGANLTQGTGRIAPGEKTDRSYLLHFLRTSGTQHWINLQIKGATFREITLTRLRELPVVLPPISLQREFARRLAVVERLKTALRSSLAELDALFASLQYRAFRGEL